MKKDIHPKIFPAIFVDLSTGAEFISFTTRKTQETKKIGDVEYNIVKVEITSDSHPFFTGKQVILDTAGRVDKFRARQKKMNEMKVSKENVEVPEAVMEAAAEEIIENTPVPMEEVMETTPVTVAEEVDTKTEKKTAKITAAKGTKKAAAAKKTPAKKSAAKKTATKKK